MSYRFYIPGRFHPAYSLLGRFIRRRNPDPLRGESLYIVAAVAIGSALLLTQTVIWTVFSPASVGLTVAVGSQIGVALVFIATCVVGWQPRIELVLDENSIEINSFTGKYRIPLGLVKRATCIDAQLFYRYYRRYERTMSFVNRIPPTLVLLELDERPVVLGLSAPDQRRLEEQLAGISDLFHVA